MHVRNRTFKRDRSRFHKYLGVVCNWYFDMRCTSGKPTHRGKQPVAPIIVPPVLTLAASCTLDTLIALPQRCPVIGEKDMWPNRERERWSVHDGRGYAVMPVPLVPLVWRADRLVTNDAAMSCTGAWDRDGQGVIRD